MSPSFIRSLFVVAVAVVGIGACASNNASGSRSASTSPAFVDMARAVRECAEGRLAQAELMKTHARFQQALDAEGDRLRDAQFRLGVLRDNGENVGERQQVLGQAEVALHAKYEQLQRRLTDEEERRLDVIRGHLRALLPQLAAAHHVSDIAETPPSQGSSLDLTDELIRANQTPLTTP